MTQVILLIFKASQDSSHTNFSDPSKSSLNLENHCISFSIQKNNRIKKERILISPENGLVIESPKKLSLRRAHKIIKGQSQWVIQHLKNVDKKIQKASHLKKNKNSVLVFGHEKKIEVRLKQVKSYVMETKNYFIIGFKQEKYDAYLIKKTLVNWLYEKAKKHFKIRARQISDGIFLFNKIVIKEQKTLWGSCSADKNLNFNWRLIMAPQFVIDYIILHELCHTKHLDHSLNFWKTVSKINPDYKKAEKWLKDYGFILKVLF